MGRALYNIGNFKLALKCYNIALALDDFNHLTYNNKGILLYDVDRYEEALELFEIAL